jgi:heliorhodopsin
MASIAAPSHVADLAGGGRLRAWNLGLALVHAAQGVAVLALANGFTLPVTGSFLQGPPGIGPSAPRTLFELSVAGAVACFYFLSALAHLLIGTVAYRRYLGDLERHRNDARWIEYSLSASLMIVVIAMITGISDVAALLALFGVNASMILFGLVQERYEEPGGGLLPFWLGCIAGALPWVAIGIYLAGPGEPAAPPTFVYAIYVSLFVFFNAFALNMWLQYRRVGKWRDYRFGETAYMILSLTAKSLLAWQVFASTLAN